MFVYVLRNEAGKEYVGMTSNLDIRLKEHNAGRVRSTKPFKPWQLAYYEECNSQLAAREREKYLKSAAGRRFRSQLWATSSGG